MKLNAIQLCNLKPAAMYQISCARCILRKPQIYFISWLNKPLLINGERFLSDDFNNFSLSSLLTVESHILSYWCWWIKYRIMTLSTLHIQEILSGMKASLV